jgi:ribosomal protein L12E/L44/L45/RPP1/RPP2
VQRAVKTAVQVLETSHAAQTAPAAAGPAAATAGSDASARASEPAAHERPSSTRTAAEPKYAAVRDSLPATPRPDAPSP